jgi:hypothetical protein
LFLVFKIRILSSSEASQKVALIWPTAKKIAVGCQKAGNTMRKSSAGVSNYQNLQNNSHRLANTL